MRAKEPSLEVITILFCADVYINSEALPDVLGQRLNQANTIQRGEKGRYNPFFRYGPLLAATLPGILILAWTVAHNAHVILRSWF